VKRSKHKSNAFTYRAPRRLLTDRGFLVLLEESRLLPLVDLQLTLRTGAVHDPEGKAGLSRLTAAMIRRGTRQLTSQAIEETIDRLGGHLSVQSGASFIHFSAIVLEQNLEPFFALLGQLLLNPAWRTADLEQLKRETVAEIVEMRDDDYTLAARHFRRFTFGKHPYGRSSVGTISSVQRIKRPDIVAHYQRHFLRQNLIIGAAGAVSAEAIGRLVDRYLGGLPSGRPPREHVPEPRLLPGRRVLIVDKPERTQTQILIGTLGARAGDSDYFALALGNTVFGGSFTARLMREVRSKRGWSYGASSRLSQDRQRDLWWMWAFPSVRDAVSCIGLEMSLLEQLVERSVSERELTFAKRFLTNGYALEIDTPVKRLSQAVEVELYNLPADYYLKFVERVRKVNRAQVGAALAKRLSTQNLAIVLVASADSVKEQLAQLPGIEGVEIIPFDAE
jgi:zinc protease